jgi:RNA polymerase sigma-70 factor (ECF subfamily)
VALADGEVVARVLAGDGEAFALLFQKYGRLVHALALARTTRRPAAAELTRKVFEKAYSGLDRMPEGATFRQFLLGALQQEAAGYVRDHGRSMQMLRVGSKEAKKAGASLELRWVLKGLNGEDAALVLLEVVGKLPPSYEGPFLLRHLEGMGQGEIADVTGLTAAEVRTALDGGRRLFERELRHRIEEAG